METLDYKAGEVVPVTSALYRVSHDPPGGKEQLQTFHSGSLFPACQECGMKVRYSIPIRLLRQKILRVG